MWYAPFDVNWVGIIVKMRYFTFPHLIRLQGVQFFFQIYRPYVVFFTRMLIFLWFWALDFRISEQHIMHIFMLIILQEFFDKNIGTRLLILLSLMRIWGEVVDPDPWTSVR